MGLAATLLATMQFTASAAQMIRPGEHIEITVYNHPELSSSAIAVNGDGSISLPIIGAVTILGLDETQAALKIQSAYGHFLRRPAVAVRVTEQAQSIFFTGAMNGVQPFQPGETIGAAISSLSAFHENSSSENAAVNSSSADLRNLHIERDGRLIGGAIDLDALARAGSSGPQLEPGDIIHIPAKPIRVEVRGNLKNPGTVYLRPGETLSQAVAEAGGYAPGTSLGRSVLTRNGYDRIVSAAGPVFTSPAHDGDIITLEPAEHVTVLGYITKPGDVELVSTPTLLNAIYLAGGPTNHADIAHVKITRGGVTTVHDVSAVMKGDASQDVMLEDGDSVLIPQGHHFDTDTFLTILGAVVSFKFLVSQ